MLPHTVRDRFDVAQVATYDSGASSYGPVPWELLLALAVVGLVTLCVTWLLETTSNGSD